MIKREQLEWLAIELNTPIELSIRGIKFCFAPCYHVGENKPCGVNVSYIGNDGYKHLDDGLFDFLTGEK